MIHIIGGAGFIGTRLAKVLANKARDFRIYDTALSGTQYVDVSLPETFKPIPQADIVINLAAEHRDAVRPSSRYQLVNVEGAHNVCNYCRGAGVNTIVFTSSVAVYGFAPEGTDESGPLAPFNEYGRTKLEAETVYEDWLAEDPKQRSLVIVRPSVVFGENNRGNVYNLLNSIANRRFIMLGPGTNKKSMAYVQNVAEFLEFSTNLGPGRHLYNYVDKPDLDMNTLVKLSREILFGGNGGDLRLPGWLGILIGHGCDVITLTTGIKLPLSSIRVKKFMTTTAFNTSIAKTKFKPSSGLAEGIERTLKHEFSVKRT